MTNYYLETLGLRPGANTTEIKAAYRRLAKQFHPDVNRSPEAKKRFIEIHEAYKFLTEVGPSPNRETVNYDFDPGAQAFDHWREKAKAYARQKAREAEKEQKRLLKTIYIYFNYFALLVASGNLLLLIDNYLPEERVPKEVIAVYKVIKQNRSGQILYYHDDIQFEGFRMRVKKEERLVQRGLKNAQVVFTPLFKTLKYADFETYNGMLRIHPAFGVYNLFIYLIPLMLVFVLAYFLVSANHQNKITLVIAVLFLSAIQLYTFIRFTLINQG